MAERFEPRFLQCGQDPKGDTVWLRGWADRLHIATRRQAEEHRPVADWTITIP
ncbi:hypothetical protein D1872_288170 [compost metagenome]